MKIRGNPVRKIHVAPLTPECRAALLHLQKSEHQPSRSQAVCYSGVAARRFEMSMALNADTTHPVGGDGYDVMAVIVYDRATDKIVTKSPDAVEEE